MVSLIPLAPLLLEYRGATLKNEQSSEFRPPTWPRPLHCGYFLGQPTVIQREIWLEGLGGHQDEHWSSNRFHMASPCAST
jgi:hypothetical protein